MRHNRFEGMKRPSHPRSGLPRSLCNAGIAPAQSRPETDCRAQIISGAEFLDKTVERGENVAVVGVAHNDKIARAALMPTRSAFPYPLR